MKFSVRPNNNGGVNLLAGQKDSEEYFEVRVLDDFLGFGLLNTSMVLQNSRDSFYVAVGSNDFDTGTTVRLSRSMYDGINYTEDTAVVLETNEDQVR